ncbi:MAG: ester cyclase [Rhizobacter sp.]|nr:ester cyclase [Ferruginibacter sp.]
MVILAACISEDRRSSVYKSEIASLTQLLKEQTNRTDSINDYLSKADTLGYHVFSNQDWTRLHETHAKNIKVTWPDGHSTIGIDDHITDLKSMFVFAPNTSIKDHPIKFGSGNMTCVTGTMTGTFSVAMPMGFGKFIPPTGKSFVLPMCTVGKWKDGVMIEEYLFWDNKTYMDQLEIEQ